MDANQSHTASTWMDPQRLLRLLGEQRELYSKLKDLSARQRGLVSGDEPEKLLQLLAERQGLVMRLAHLNQEFAPFRRNWQAVYDQLPPESQRQASGSLEEINEMLRFILQADQQDGALLAARKQSVANSLSELSGGRAVHAAYSRGPATGGGTANVTV